MMHGQKNIKLLIAVKQFNVHAVLGQIFPMVEIENTLNLLEGHKISVNFIKLRDC